MSAFREAVQRLEPACPKCGARDLQPPAKPTLEVEQDGSLTCAQCSTNFHAKDG